MPKSSELVRPSAPPLGSRRRWWGTAAVLGALYLSLAVAAAMHFTDRGVPHLDEPAMSFVARHRGGLLTSLFTFDTRAFWDAGGVVVLLIVAAALILTRRRAGAVWLLASVVAVPVANTVVKAVVQRVRPTVYRIPGFEHEPGYAFSSGHSAFGFALFLCVAFIVVPEVTHTWLRWLIAIVCVAAAVSIAYSRIYVGVHWPTDILGSALLATSWLTGTYPAYSRRSRPAA